MNPIFNLISLSLDSRFSNERNLDGRQGISAVGSLLCAVTTFFAALVALVMGCSERKMSVYARRIFFEDNHYDLVEHHSNCFIIKIICDGNQPVYNTHVLEWARFKKYACGAKGWLESRTHTRECWMPGRAIPNLRRPKYWTLHPLSSAMKLEPGEVGYFAISFIRLLAVQKERKELDIFDLDVPLSFNALDVSGKKYKLHSDATPNSFLEESTAKMTRVSPLTGELVRNKVR